MTAVAGSESAAGGSCGGSGGLPPATLRVIAMAVARLASREPQERGTGLLQAIAEHCVWTQ
jgi:hypothetical protein